MEGARDFIGPFFGKRFAPEDKFKENTKKSMDKYLPLFERVSEYTTVSLLYEVFVQILSKASCAGHLVGDSLTVADLAFFEVLLLVNEEHPDAMDEYKRVKVCSERFGRRNTSKFRLFSTA